MGINHSKIYNLLIENKNRAEENINEIGNLKNLEIFTNDDIVSLCTDVIYKKLFEEHVLAHHVYELYYKLTKDEYYNILINSINILREEMFFKLIKEYEKNKEILKKLRTNEDFSELFKKYSLDIITRKVMLKESNLLEFLKEDDIIYLIKNMLKYLHGNILESFINEIKDNIIYLEEIFKNIECTPDFLLILKTTSDTLYYNSLIKKYQDEIYSSIYNIDSNKFKNSIYKTILEQIIKEVLELTNSKLENIQYIKEGASSKVYRIGNLVLKTGNSRFVHEIPNHDRILYPLLRRKIGDLYIEVSDFVDTKNITDDDVYMIFKELMDSGIVWVDPRRENIGRLLKDSNSYDIYVSEETVGLIGKNKMPRKAGELAIIDTDLIFYEYNIPWGKLYKYGLNFIPYNKMIDRYMKEKQEINHL